MISIASQPSQHVMQNHPMMRAATHSTALLLSDDFLRSYAKPRKECVPGEQPQVKTWSTRRKLWDLNPNAICPVMSVCLHFHEVQKMAHKVGLRVDKQPDYEQRRLVLQELGSRNALSEMVQRLLDRRFVLAINRSQRIKTTATLAQWWDEVCASTDWAGEFWAVLMHPQCSTDLESRVLGQVQMLQGQIGIAARSEARRLEQVLAQNQRLTQDLAKTRQRLQSQAAEHALAVAALQAECARLRGQVVRAEAERDLVQAQSAELGQLTPGLRASQHLAQDHARVLSDSEKLLMRTLRREVEPAPQPTIKPVTGQGGADNCAPQSIAETGPMLDLQQRSVLCVGGRTQGIPVYREVIENRGARFTHHDGGEEEKAGRLERQLQAADLVICQVGCISHDAYWRVKAHCKRTGKPCLFVEMPSRSALERALRHSPSQMENAVPLMT